MTDLLLLYDYLISHAIHQHGMCVHHAPPLYGGGIRHVS